MRIEKVGGWVLNHTQLIKFAKDTVVKVASNRSMGYLTSTNFKSIVIRIEIFLKPSLKSQTATVKTGGKKFERKVLSVVYDFDANDSSNYPKFSDRNFNSHAFRH